MPLGCLTGFSRHRAVYDDPPATPMMSKSFDANALPKKSAIRHSPGDSPSCTHSVASRQSSSGLEYVQVLQDFNGQDCDELDVCVGQKLKVLYVEDEWTYVSTCFNSPRMTDRCGFVPTNFCKRVLTDRNVKFADGPPLSLCTSDGTASLPNPYHSISVTPARCIVEDSPESDYVSLRTPTLAEQNMISSGYPYKARVLYNFTDGAIDRVCVRRGEEVTVLGQDAADSSWSTVHRSNGKQGLVPTCFLQTAGTPVADTVRRNDSVNSASSANHRPHRGVRHSESASSIICYQNSAGRQDSTEAASWMQDASLYDQPSPGHSTASSDSGYAAVAHRPRTASVSPSSDRSACVSRMSNQSPDKMPSHSVIANRTVSVPRATPSPCINSSPRLSPAPPTSSQYSVTARSMKCIPTSSADSGTFQEDSYDFPPPPPESMLNVAFMESNDKRFPRIDHGRRKLAQRRQLGARSAMTPADETIVNQLADQLVQIASSRTSSPAKKSSQGTQDGTLRRQPPPVAPKPRTSTSPKPTTSSSSKPSSTPPKVSSLSPKPTGSARPDGARQRSPSPKDGNRRKEEEAEENEECLLVLCRYTADGDKQLSVEQGDIVYGDPSLAGESRGWVWVYCARLKEHGFIPVVYTQPCNPDGQGGVVTEI